MVSDFQVNKILWSITAVLAAFASIAGIIDINIYNDVVSKEIIPGAFSQDLQSFAAACILLILAIMVKVKNIKLQIVVFGILGYFFYAYGIYVIERAYNMYYLLYMAIFTLSFWAMIYGLANLKKDIMQKVNLSKKVRIVSAAGALLQPLLFYPLWISALIPLMQTGKQIDSLYSIYIIDLCFIMPAFAILAYYTFINKGVGLLLLPAMYILGFTLIFSLAVGELVKPLFGMSVNSGAFLQSLGLSIFFLVLGVIHLRQLTITRVT